MRAGAAERDAGDEERIGGLVVDDRGVGGDLAVAAGDFHFDAAVGEGDVLRGEEGVELLLLAGLQVEREVEQVLAGARRRR